VSLHPVGGLPVPELLARLQAGHRDALSTLYKALFEELWRIALLQTRSPESANEIVQDVFLWLWARHATIRTDTDIRVYLAVAVRNRARSLNRHARVVQTTKEMATAAIGADEPLAMGQFGRSSDTLVEDQEFRAAYHRAVATLTDQERLAVFLRWEEDWTFEQVGHALAISKVGARKVVLRAQQKVRALLEDYRG
jgi:RNA polymerase sigma-70 factor (ECF subfamily)